MVKKLFLSGILFISGCFSAMAQDQNVVEVQDDKVLLNGKQILKYERINLFQHSFYSLDDNEILMYKYNDNETSNNAKDDYMILNFLTAKKKIESADTMKATAGLGLNSKKNMQKMITWLLKEKVIGTDGQLDLARLETFFEKYDENITERTIR